MGQPSCFQCTCLTCDVQCCGTATVASVLKHELGAGATPYSSSHTRRFVFSLLNSLYQDKAKQSRGSCRTMRVAHLVAESVVESAAGSSLLQRSLLLLTKVTLLVNRHEGRGRIHCVGAVQCVGLAWWLMCDLAQLPNKWCQC